MFPFVVHHAPRRDACNRPGCIISCMPDVTHNTARHRFEITQDGHTAVLDYMTAGNKLVLTHTGVPQELEGKGIGTSLVKAALDHARSASLKVDPQCPFVGKYIERHSEYADLVA